MREAFEDYNEAVGARPQAAEPLIDRGVARLLLGLLDLCVHDLSWAIQLNPNLAMAFSCRAEYRHAAE